MQELKDKFKDNIYKTGIYKISAKYDNSLFYIGMSSRVTKANCKKGFYTRWYGHLNELKKNKHCNPFLQRIYNKYTKESLVFEIVEFCSSNECATKEMEYIEKLKPPLNLYKNKYCRTDYRVSYETRCKISNANTGRKNTEETKLKMRLSAYREQCRYINKEKVYVKDLINIPIDLLDEIKISILEKDYTINKIKETFKINKDKLIRNLTLYFKDDLLIEKLKTNKLPYTPRYVYSKSRDPLIINEVLNLYRKELLFSEIRKILNINEDLLGLIVKENMDEEERKSIRTKNKKRMFK